MPRKRLTSLLLVVGIVATTVPAVAGIYCHLVQNGPGKYPTVMIVNTDTNEVQEISLSMARATGACAKGIIGLND